MSNTVLTPGVVPNRLSQEQYQENFSDLHPALSEHAAAVEADRCYFCYDAPCIAACPTEIDIPLFIRQISTGTPEAAARTIFDSNIMGGMCARVCPTETLCEEACVRYTAEKDPVEIGRLQRFATDTVMQRPDHPYKRGPLTGKSIAVVGAGPAGLACAHRLAMKGHEVTVFERRLKAGGLNEFGIAAYKTVDGFAGKEVEWILGIGGIHLVFDDCALDAKRLKDLQERFDAVFLSVGLNGVNALMSENFDKANIISAVDFIGELRQAENYSEIPIGRNVVIIGGGMTAIDAGVQSRMLGAENVTLVYRRSRAEMGASQYEQDLAGTRGVKFIENAVPTRAFGSNSVESIEFERTETAQDGLIGTNDRFQIQADLVLIAIGQKLDGFPSILEFSGRKIKVSETGQTSIQGIWAGGDCASMGEDLTVVAVAQGRDAAEDIHKTLQC